MEALGRRLVAVAIDASALTAVDSPGTAGLLRVRLAVTDAAWRSGSATLHPHFGAWPSLLASRRCYPASDTAPERSRDARHSPARPRPGASERLSGG
jgi:hypothetical protein